MSYTRMSTYSYYLINGSQDHEPTFNLFTSMRLHRKARPLHTDKNL